MWLLGVFLLCVGICGDEIQNFEVLNEFFFENLKGIPFLAAKDALDETSRNFIDQQTDNYINMVTGAPTTKKKKRSLLDKYTENDRGMYLLTRLVPTATVPVRFPQDTIFFKRGSTNYVATLESPNARENADFLVIFAVSEDENYDEIARISVGNATKLSIISTDNFTLLAVAENEAPKSNLHDKSAIFQFDSSTLIKIQSIDMHYASDVVMWRIHNEIYMSVAQFTSNKSGNIHYEIEIPIYKWLGRHFDLLQNISSKGAMKIRAFKVRNTNFLAVANFRNDLGDTNVYSEIFKFDYDSERYEIYQRILTKACADVEVFTFESDLYEESFLVVANLYEIDDNGDKNYETESIIYKFVDNYFIPFQSLLLNAVAQWIPVRGFNSEFVLFASSRFDGLRAFQYDGWSFREVSPKMEKTLKNSGMRSVRSVSFDDSSMIVVSNENNDGKIPNVFKLEFEHQNTLKEVYEGMINWCDRSLKKVEYLLDGSLFEVVLGKPERADIDEDQFEEVSSRIKSLNSALDQLKIEKIYADTIVFNNVTFTHNLETEEINNFAIVDVFDNVLNIEDGFELDAVSLSSAITEDRLKSKTINGFDNNTLIHGSDDLELDRLEVRGSVITPEGVKIEGQLNGISIENFFTDVNNQTFSHPVIMSHLKVDNTMAQGTTEDEEPPPIEYIENLVVKDLTIGGYINQVDVPTLDKYALKIKGDQVIVSNYIFDTLKVKNFEIVGRVSGREIDELIDIDAANQSIKQDIIFEDDIFINNLEISEFLNNIEVKDGKLDVLLKNQTEEQEIPAEKIFDDVVIYNAIYLQGHINSTNFEVMNPVVSVSEDILLEGDKIISGQVQIEEILKVEDIITRDGVYSLSKLSKEGVKLTTKEIKPHLYFTQLLNVNEIFVDTVNDKSPQNFVVTGLNEPQIIEGTKIFLGDLKITGSTNALKINNVDVEDLDNRVLKVEGDQTVLGKHHIKHIVANRISAKVTQFDKNLSQITTNDENLIINDGLKIDSIKVKKIDIKGLVNDLEFDRMVNDTVRIDETRLINSHKYLYNLTVDTINVDKGITFEEIEDFDKLVLQDRLDIENVKIENLYFEDRFNGVDKNSFGEVEHQISTVEVDHVFDTVTVYGKVYIADNKINDVDMTDFAENSVKIDESFTFDTATFEDAVICKNIHLKGAIENVDLDNLILSNDTRTLEIYDEKIFENNLTINGTVKTQGLMSGVNLTNFCQLTGGEIHLANVTIDGDVFFAKGPNVAQINGFDIKNITSRAWFSDQDTTLTGSIEFEDVIFENDIEVGSLFENINISFLYENYFSKSKDQEIAATFIFENDLIFDNDIEVANITGKTDINNINLDEFVSTALLNDFDQVFETVAFFENFSTQNLTGEYTVNGLDLIKEVMRYDQVNMVVGPKTFENLNVTFLKLDRHIKIQNVDVLEWLKSSFLKTTSYNITGPKKFKNVKFDEGFEIGGTLNGLKFDTENIMVKDMPQNITGPKTIHTSALNPVTFKGIKLKGVLNDIDVSDFVNKQAYQNQNNIFKTSLNLFNNITTNNLLIKKTYRGVNMTEVISNVTNLGILNNLLDQYHRLTDMSYVLKESIQRRAFFLNYFKIVQTIPFIDNSQKILCSDDVTRLGTVVSGEEGTKMLLYSLKNEKFVYTAAINFSEHPVYISQVLGGRYLYTEEENGVGHFVPMPPKNKSLYIRTNVTISTTSFELQNGRICTLFTYSNDQPKIFCEVENTILLEQILNSPIISKAHSILIGDATYLLLVSEPIEAFESRIDLWKNSDRGAQFEYDQSLFVARPTSVSSSAYRGVYYLAVASGHLQNAMYSGCVHIYKFDHSDEKFVLWQSLETDAPGQVEFAVLPSGELILYVVSNNPTEPLLVYGYEGVFGFTVKVKGSSLPEILYLNHFSGSGSHFIITQSNEEINVVKAVFKGEILDDEI